MDAQPIARCDSKQFQKIYKDLVQLGTPNHERIVIHKEGQQRLPGTAKKGVFDFSTLDETSKARVLEFLENHIDRLCQQEHAHHLFLKLESLFEGQQKIHFNQIHQLFFKSMALLQLENQKLAMEKEEEQHLLEVETQRLQDIEKLAHEKENELMKQLQTRAHTAEGSIDKLEKRLALLKQENSELEDTLLRCRDGELHFHMKLLEKVCFFKVYKHNQQRGMKKTCLSPEEEKKFNYGFEFKDSDSKIIDIFTQWLLSPAVLESIDKFDDLCELYRLSDFLNDDFFQADCLKQIKKHLDDDNVLMVLSSAEYSSEDSFIQACCHYAVDNFKTLAAHPKFAEIQSEYIAPILKSDFLHVENEEKIFTALISWAEAQAKKNKTPLTEVLNAEVHGKRILDSIRFENLSKEQFISHVLPLKQLSAEEVNHWLTYYLTDEPSPHPRFYTLQCKVKGQTRANITWNIPLKEFYSLGEWDKQAIISRHFTFKGYTWEIQMGTETRNVIIGIVARDPKADFEFFLEINKLQYFSQPPKQEIEQAFENDGRDEGSYIRGVCYKFKALYDNIDSTTRCLPLKLKIFMKNTS